MTDANSVHPLRLNAALPAALLRVPVRSPADVSIASVIRRQSSNIIACIFVEINESPEGDNWFAVNRET